MEKMIGKVAVVIPSYEPEEKLVELVSCLKAQRMTPIYVINDGSGEQYQKIFNDIEQVLDGAGCLLVHNVNRGKGRALKTAFRYIIEKEPNVIGVVTADSDGQHSIESIEKNQRKVIGRQQ